MGYSRYLSFIGGRWVAALLLLTVTAIWLATADFALIDRLQYVSSGERAVSSGSGLVQTFTTTGENISRIDLVLARTPEDPGAVLDLRVVEADAPTAAEMFVSGATLAEASLDTGSYDYRVIRRLEFDPVAVTPGEQYAFSLSSNTSDADPVEAGANPRDEYAGGHLYVDGMPTEGDLYFAVFHKDSAGGMLEKMEPWRPFLLKSPYLIAALLLVGAGAFGWLLREMVAAPGEPDTDT